VLSRYDAFISYSQAADGEFGAALQQAMERLAKPWRQRRSLEVFRDLTGLAASPDLWGSIVEAMDAAEWFVLLASPQAAESTWVGEEIRHWVETKGTSRILVVVTDGTWVWDAERGDVDLERSTAAHPALAGVFGAEPRHMDLSWARTEDDLTLRNVRFGDAIAEIVAPMHGLTKDELVGEDVRQQRRTTRWVRATVAVLTFLAVAAMGATGAAIAAAGEASRQEERAVAERERAEEQERIAESERERAEEQARLADSRRLARLSGQLQSADGALSRLLAVEAFELAPTAQAEHALADALRFEGDAVFSIPSGAVHGRLVGHDPRLVDADFTPDGEHVVSLDASGTIRIWSTADVGTPTTVHGTTGAAIAVGGSGGTIGVLTGTGLRILDLAGDLVRTVDETRTTVTGGGLVTGAPAGYAVADGGQLTLVDEDGAVGASTEITGVATALRVTDDGMVVVGFADGRVLRLDGELEELGSWTHSPSVDLMDSLLPAASTILDISADGSAVVVPDGLEGEVADPRRPIAAVYDTVTGGRRATIIPHDGWLPQQAADARFVGDSHDAVAVSPYAFAEAPASLGTTLDPGFQAFTLPWLADVVRVSPDGRFLLVAGDDPVVALASREDPDADGGDDMAGAIADVCRLAGRNISEQEWAQYRPDAPYAATCPQYAAPHDPGDTGLTAAAAPRQGEADGADGFAAVDFANSRYPTTCPVGDVVQLVDGTASNGGARVRLEGTALIDVNGDGVEDAAVVLRCNTGANNVFTDALVFDGAAGADLVQIGQIVTGQAVVGVEAGRIITQDPEPAPSDPLCCPSQFLRTTWELDGEEWVAGQQTAIDPAEAVHEFVPPETDGQEE
jgi:hypothetical protein